MSQISTTSETKFIIPADEDWHFDNTPQSPEDEQLMVEMIQKLKAESGDTYSVKLPTKTE